MSLSLVRIISNLPSWGNTGFYSSQMDNHIYLEAYICKMEDFLAALITSYSLPGNPVG